MNEQEWIWISTEPDHIPVPQRHRPRIFGFTQVRGDLTLFEEDKPETWLMAENAVEVER